MEETEEKFPSGAPRSSRPSSIRCNMECSGGSREDDDTVSMACMSSFNAGNPADGDWRFDGDDRILFKRFCDR